MDFKDSIHQIAERIETLKNNMQTEEATKNALIMPFIKSLGYDVFNPLEVLPEMSCDIGTKKGEKIDYAILQDGAPIMLIECKHWKQNLNLHDNQLMRYFNVSKARFGVLTNGIIYRFYTDLANTNIMDDKPFLEINLLEMKDNNIEELKKFHKSYFDVNNILSTASELKYLNELKQIISAEFDSPSSDFVKFFGKQVYQGQQFTSKIQEQFSTLTKRAINSYFNDMISDRLTAVINNSPRPTEEDNDEDTVEEVSKIITTEDELEAFYLIKSILRNSIPSERITYRDSQSYFAIFIDNNNRKTVCRLYFNTADKRIVFLDEEKKVIHRISSIDDIYNYSEQLISAVSKFI